MSYRIYHQKIQFSDCREVSSSLSLLLNFDRKEDPTECFAPTFKITHMYIFRFFIRTSCSIDMSLN